jgi:hypothetical protein
MKNVPSSASTKSKNDRRNSRSMMVAWRDLFLPLHGSVTTDVGPTDLPFSRAAPPRGDGGAARRLPRLTICSAGAKCNRRDATALATAAAANGAASAATASYLAGSHRSNDAHGGRLALSPSLRSPDSLGSPVLHHVLDVLQPEERTQYRRRVVGQTETVKRLTERA